MTAYRTLPVTDQLPYALYRAEQVREFDRLIIEQYQISGEELMLRAGEAVFALIKKRYPDQKNITVIAGVGNNGGDGFVVARLARQAGFDVHLILPGKIDDVKNDALIHLIYFLNDGGCVDPLTEIPPQSTIIVDALLGTGLSREVSGQFEFWINQMNQHAAPVIAVDIPSGLSADNGSCFGSTVVANATLSFIGLKQGLFTGQAANYVGEIFFDSLAIPARVYASQILSARRVDWQKLSGSLPVLPRTAHKGHRGHVLIIGGDHGYAGAILLAAKAALRAGAGLVSVITRKEHVAAALSFCPEIMLHGVNEKDDISRLMDRVDVVAIGPGLGQNAWGKYFWEKIKHIELPLVIDADGLNLLANDDVNLKHAVLTPHPGEASKLLGMSVKDIESDRFAAVHLLKQRFNSIAVLKGAGTLIADQSTSPVAVCSDGNPGMASAGMGDVLTGIIASLIAQGMALSEASIAGVCLHAASADAAAHVAGEKGLLASDLFPHIRRLVNTK